MHWLDKILDIFDAETVDLRKLAEISGGDPRYFYIGTNIVGADISGQDLRGMILPNLDLSKVIYDQNTKLDQLTEADFLEEITRLEIRKKLILISKLRRQEERLVSFIKLYLDNSGYENFIDDLILEKSEFSARFISDFRKIYSKGFFGEQFHGKDYYGFIDSMINKSFPQNRGYLILYLAKYFGNDRGIVSLLKKRLVPNATMTPFLEEVNELLAEWAKPTVK